MCGNPLEVLSPVGAIFGAASRQRKAQRQQDAAQAAALAAQQKTLADGQKAEANARRQPNFNAIFDRNSLSSGVSATMLTGAGGVTNGLSLGKNSLLGGGA